MTETNWNVPTQDGHRIYGVKSSVHDSADSAIFMVHGLTSSIHDYNMKYSADHFAADYDVYRISLYGAEDGARQLVDCTIETHAGDLNTVLAALATRYRRVFVIGHSYGGPTVMVAKPSGITAVSLWDPSFDLKSARDKYQQFYVPLDKYVAITGGSWSIIGKPMYDEKFLYDEAYCTELAKSFGYPVQVILAGNGYYVTQPYSYDSFGNPQNTRDVVLGTRHCFHEGTTCDELLAKTGAWFDRF